MWRGNESPSPNAGKHCLEYTYLSNLQTKYDVKEHFKAKRNEKKIISNRQAQKKVNIEWQKADKSKCK